MGTEATGKMVDIRTRLFEVELDACEEEGCSDSAKDPGAAADEAVTGWVAPVMDASRTSLWGREAVSEDVQGEGERKTVV